MTTRSDRRIFIAIPIPEDVRAALQEVLTVDSATGASIYEVAQMTGEEKWHITIEFFGAQPEKAVATIEKVTEHVVQTTSAPTITVRTLSTAPAKRPPQMFWAKTTAETDIALGTLREKITKELVPHGINKQGMHFQIYAGHITLAYFPKGRRIEERVISLATPLTFQAKSIDVMESRLSDTGSTYSLIRSIDFKPSV